MKQKKLISASGLQEVIGKILEGDKRSVEDIVRIENIFLVKDESYIRDFVEYIINNNVELVTKYKTETRELSFHLCCCCSWNCFSF